MKILCTYSSIEFSCEHFPGRFYSRDTYHPIFSLPQKKLLGYLGKWAGGQLTQTDSYLLFLALLKSSDLVDFRVPAVHTPFTDSIIATNMEYLAKTVSKLDAITAPSVNFPHYVISPETKTLSNVHYWIENWEESYNDFTSGKRREYDDRQVARREFALERLIKNPHKPISAYSKQLAEWASIAGSFPTSLTPSPFSGLQVSISDLWKQIIEKCAHETQLYSIPKKDLIELQEHCEEFIPVGSIHSHALFKIISNAIKRQSSFLNLGDIDITKTTYQILSDTDTVESANIKAMLDSSPESAPKESDYPTKIAFLRAQMRWNLSRKLGKNSGDFNV